MSSLLPSVAARRLATLFAVVALVTQAAALPAVAADSASHVDDGSDATPTEHDRRVDTDSSDTDSNNTDSSDTDSNDTEVISVDGDGDADYRTLRAAVAAASSGDTVHVQPGTYTPNETITLTESIRITAPEGATIRPEQSGSDGSITATDDTSPVFDIPVKSTAAPVIEGFTVYNRTVLETYYAEGAFVLRDLTVRDASVAVDATHAESDWLLDGVTVVTDGAAVVARDTTGAWTVRNSTIRLASDDRFSSETGIDASRSTGPWTVQNTTITGGIGGVVARDASADFTLRGVRIRETTTAVVAHGATGDWRVLQSTLVDGSTDDRVPVYPPFAAGTAVFAANTTGEWAIRGTVFRDNDGTDVIANNSAVRGDARGNTWDGSRTPDADACVGNVTCGGEPVPLPDRESTNDTRDGPDDDDTGDKSTDDDTGDKSTDDDTGDKSTDDRRATPPVTLVHDGNRTTYDSVQAAVDAAADGDTIRLGAGTYRPERTVVLHRNVTVTAPDGARILPSQQIGVARQTATQNDDGNAPWNDRDLGAVTPVFEIPDGTHAAPTIAGLTVEGRALLTADSTTGDWVVRDVTVRHPNDFAAVSAVDTAGDWVVTGATVFTEESAVQATDASGAWTITDSQFHSPHESTEEMIDAVAASGAWRIDNTTVHGSSVAVAARVTSGDWTVSDVRVSGAMIGVSAYRATGNWTITDAAFRNVTTSANLTFGMPPLREGTAVFAAGTNGSWAVRDSTFRNSERVDVDAEGAVRRGDARTNTWDGSATPDADACVGNVTCRRGGTETGDTTGGDETGDTTGGDGQSTTPADEQPLPYNTTLQSGGDDNPLAAGAGQAVNGTTDLSAGSELRLLLRSTSGTGFLSVRTAVVDDRGRFRAVFDLAGVASGTEYELLVEHDAERITTVAAELQPCAGAACDRDTDDRTETGDDAGRNVTSVTATLDTAGTTDGLALAADAGQAVTGETTLRPGTTVTVRLAYRDGQPFLRSRESTVGSDGRFRAVFNLSGIDGGTTFDAVVRANDAAVASARGRVVDCSNAPASPVCGAPDSGPPAATAQPTPAPSRTATATEMPLETTTPARTSTTTPSEEATAAGTTTTTPAVVSAESTATGGAGDWVIVLGLLGVGGAFGVFGIALLLGVVEI